MGLGSDVMDRDDIEQALEIACGSEIGSELSSRRTASDASVARTRAAVVRFLRELPDDLTVNELKEAFDE